METMTFRNTFLNLWTWHFYWANFREVRAPGMHWQELWGSGCFNSKIELISIMESSVSSVSQHHAIFSLWGSAQTSWPIQHSSPVNCKSICLLAGHCVQVQSPPVQGNHSITCTYRPTSASPSWENQGRKVSGEKQTQGSTWWSRLEVSGGQQLHPVSPTLDTGWFRKFSSSFPTSFHSVWTSITTTADLLSKKCWSLMRFPGDLAPPFLVSKASA